MAKVKTCLILQFLLLVPDVLTQKACTDIFKAHSETGHLGELIVDYSKENSLNLTVQGFITGNSNLDVNLEVTLATLPESIRNSSTIKYRIYSPQKDIVPEITSIEFNGKLHCYSSPVEGNSEGVIRLRSNSLYNVLTDSEECELENEKEILKKDEFPWHVTIFRIEKEDDLRLLCPGTLISKQHVLTAGHCVTSYKPEQLIFIVGQPDLIRWVLNGPLRRTASSITVHPDSKPGMTADGDLGIVKLKQPIFSSFARPVEIWPGDNNLAGEEGIVPVWYDSRQKIPWAKKAFLPIVSKEQCLRSNKHFIQITSSRTFCAGGKNHGALPCRGDSGGGLFIKQGEKYYLRGITSLGLVNYPDVTRCNKKDYVVFVDVSKYSNWIKAIISNE